MALEWSIFEYFNVLGTVKTSEPCRIQICMYRLDRKSNTGDIYRGFAMSRKMTFGDDFYAIFFGRELINGMCNKGRIGGRKIGQKLINGGPVHWV